MIQIHNRLKTALLAAAVTGLAAGGAQAADNVILAFPSPVGVNNSDLAFGMELGIFAEEGINLEIVSFQGSAVVIPQVANGSVTFGMADSSFLISAIDKGEDIPVHFVYNFVRTVANNFAVMADSPIKTVADLKGKKLGTISANAATLTLTKAVLKDAGLSWEEIQPIPIGLGPAAWKQLETNAVDAVNFFRPEDAKMRLAGMDIRQILYPEKFSDIFVASIVSSQKTIEEQPDLVARFGRAVAKSSVACLANQEACVKAYWSYDPSSKPEAGKEDKWVQESLPILKANYETVGYFKDGKQVWGQFPEGSLTEYIKAMHEAGIISKDGIDQNRIYTNDFVTKFNDFDRAAIEERARAHKN